MNKLVELIKEYALEIKPEGEYFTLKSGEKSRFYLNIKKLTLHSIGLCEIVDRIWRDLKWINFDAIGGDADPIVGGLLYRCNGTNINGFLVKEKDHGKSGLIVGSVKPGDKCILIKDVITTGQTTINCIKLLQEFGAEVIHVFCVVDRGGMHKVHISTTSLVTLDQLGLV